MGSSSVIRLGIIGAGSVARQHLTALGGVEGMEAVGITSRTKAKAQQLADEFNIPVCAPDIDSLILQAKPDALMILVSVDQVYDVCCKAIPYKLPMFIEKPAGMVPQETWRLCQLASQHEVKTMVGYNRRFYSIFHRGMDLIREKGPLLGVSVEGHERIWQVRAKTQHSEHVLSHWVFANMTHTVDLLRLFGGDPVQVHSLSRRLKEPHGDQFAAVLDFASGAIGTYSAYWHSPGGWRVVLYGDGVTVEFKPLEKGTWTDSLQNVHDIVPESYDVQFKPGFVKQMENFRGLVRDGVLEWPGEGLDGAYKTMLLAETLTRGVTDYPRDQR